jgi:branched-chain amino acid transport system permease protein
VFAFYHVSYYHELAFEPTWTFDAVLPVYVGGVGTLAGPVVGAVFYIVARETLAVTLVQVNQIVFGVLFIAVVLAMPGGLVAGWRRWWTARRTSPRPDGSAPDLAGAKSWGFRWRGS